MFVAGDSDVLKGFRVVVLISNKLQDSIEGWAGPDVQSAQSNCKKAPCYMALGFVGTLFFIIRRQKAKLTT
jgi:hypothetical protein